MAALTLHGREVEGVREHTTGEQARHEEEPRAANAAPVSVDDREQRKQHDVDERVVLARVAGFVYPRLMNSAQLPGPQKTLPVPVAYSATKRVLK